MKIAEIIRNDLSKREDLNCAESVLRAANDDLGLGLDRKALRLASGFGGGMGVGHACGALTGAVMVLGVLYVKERAHESTRIKDVEQKLIAAFEKEYGTIMCRPIKDAHSDPEYKCKSVILKSAELLEDLLRSDPPDAGLKPAAGG
jgi:C_GCAxxG_C_C family probable redox protein